MFYFTPSKSRSPIFRKAGRQSHVAAAIEPMLTGKVGNAGA